MVEIVLRLTHRAIDFWVDVRLREFGGSWMAGPTLPRRPSPPWPHGPTLPS